MLLLGDGRRCLLGTSSGTPVSVTPVSVTLVINFDRSSNSRPKSGHVGNVRRSQINADKGSKRSTAASVASEKMVKKNTTNSKNKGGYKGREKKRHQGVIAAIAGE